MIRNHLEFTEVCGVSCTCVYCGLWTHWLHFVESYSLFPL